MNVLRMSNILIFPDVAINYKMILDSWDFIDLVLDDSLALCSLTDYATNYACGTHVSYI